MDTSELSKLTEQLLMTSSSPFEEELQNAKKTIDTLKKKVKHKKHIVIVEDDDTTRFILSHVLAEQNNEVHECQNGQIAVDYYKQNYDKIDLIYMDIMMPVKDGIEATNEIRVYEKEKKLPRKTIVALTAYPEMEKKCLEAGMDKVLGKLDLLPQH